MVCYELKMDLICQHYLYLTKKLKYEGLATIEFLVNVEKNDYRFIECNPRLQVDSVDQYVEIMKNLDLKKPAQLEMNVSRNINLGREV